MATITGSPAGEPLNDTAGDDTIMALGGDDSITVTAGKDAVDGGDDIDRLIVAYGGATVAVMSAGENSFVAADGATGVTFDNVESFDVTTGSGDDTIRTFFREDVTNNNNANAISGNDFITLGAGADRAAGGSGDDELHGGVGDDILDGDGSLSGKFGGGNLSTIEFMGDDTLYGDEGNDRLYGGNGADILDGGIGDDQLFGDRIVFQANDSSTFGGESVKIQENVGNDMLSGDDILDGGEGNDLIVGNAGDDMISGGSGNDTARQTLTSDGADATNLGTGDDIVEISANANADVSSRVRIAFTSAEVGNGNALDSGTMANQDGGLAVRVQSENYADGLVGPISRYDDEGITFIASTPGVTFDVRDLVSDVARGDQFEVVTLGTMASDTLTAVQADRAYYINAGMGDDTVFGGNANDFLVGGVGNDTITGGLGDDSGLAGAGMDRLNFNVSTDGSDRFDLGADADLVNVTAATAGQVRLTFTSAEVGNGLASDSNSMANQDGGLAVRFQAEDAMGNLAGPVSRFDDEGITFVASTPGVTFDVRDLVSGVARGDQFEVVTLGTSAGETLTAVQADRAYYINGGMGDDTVIGGNANDFLVGGAGNDTLTGDLGLDSFIGGGGNDSYYVDNSAETIVEAVGGGTDSVFASSSYALGAEVENLTLLGANGAKSTDAFSGTGNGLANTITGNAGANLLSGLAGDDRIEGGAGDDKVNGDDGDDLLSGGAGNDAVNGGMGNDQLFGQIGNDRLAGGVGDDALSGGLGNDVLLGGMGDDRLTGGAGGDFFTFAAIDGASSNDLVVDFAADSDLLIVRDMEIAAIADGGSGAVITFDTGATATLKGVMAGNLSAADFLFQGTAMGDFFTVA